jgi:hypothetical protein
VEIGVARSARSAFDRPALPLLDFILFQFRELHQVPEKSGFQGCVAVNRHGQPNGAALSAIDVMTAIGS